ncbi:MAG: rubrerythrin family protein [Desulfobacteraceae bacterium]|jgi:rubrerythrin
MSERVAKNLASAFASESKAAVRNAAFALKADQEGHPQLARLFRAVADADSVHARRFLLLMRGKIGTTEENLEAALQNEEKANEEYYPEMVKDAQGSSKAVKKAFSQSMKTDGQHAALFEEAKADMFADNETDYYVCHICGHISVGFVPENCPVCHAVSGRFRRVM